MIQGFSVAKSVQPFVVDISNSVAVSERFQCHKCR